MPKKTLITSEQIIKAKEMLNALPQRELDKTREETAVILEKDFLKVIKKGYSIQEISSLLKEEGIQIPATLIKKIISNKNSL